MITRAEIAALLDAKFEDVIKNPIPPREARNYSIRTTSGTSGRGPLVTISEHAPRASEGYAQVSSAVLCFGSRGARMANLLFAWNSTNGPRRIITLGGIADLRPGLDEILNDMLPERISGTPSIIARASEHISERVRSNVTKLLCNGELVTSTMREFLVKRYPRARITITYVTTETGLIGNSRCDHLRPNQYHPIESAYIEIDAEKVGEEGEILVTKKQGGAARITQYRTGDIGRIVATQCPCGAEQTFEVLGRSGYDYIKLAGIIIRLEEVERVLALVDQCFDDYRIELSSATLKNDKYIGTITLRLFRASGPVSESEQRDMIRIISDNLYVTPTKTYSDMVSAGYVRPLTIEYSNTPFLESRKRTRVMYVS